jgi:hypothetical protein
VKVSQLTAEDCTSVSRLGFMSGEVAVPDDFDAIGTEVIQALFEGRQE